MTNEEFIIQHREENTLELALKKWQQDIDLPYCLQQIEGWQLARKKIPLWAQTEGIIYPVRLSMEQCSSEKTAEYKKGLIEKLIPQNERSKMIDLTGGLGVDFGFMAGLFDEATYVEQQEALCRVAQHNFGILGLDKAQVVCGTCEEQLQKETNCSLLFLDPARRDNAGKKVFILEDCTPNVCELYNQLMQCAPWVMIKLSPMLDIKQALQKLPHAAEVHIVSVEGECKELLIILSKTQKPLTYHCVNILKESTEYFVFGENIVEAPIAHTLQTYLYEPNASILKSGGQDALCAPYGIEKLHPFSHLYCSDELMNDFPGRKFKVVEQYDFGKRELKEMVKRIPKANFAIRNFPSTVAELRKKLNIKEGGNVYLFATTLHNEKHVIIQCEKV